MTLVNDRVLVLQNLKLQASAECVCLSALVFQVFLGMGQQTEYSTQRLFSPNVPISSPFLSQPSSKGQVYHVTSLLSTNDFCCCEKILSTQAARGGKDDVSSWLNGQSTVAEKISHESLNWLVTLYPQSGDGGKASTGTAGSLHFMRSRIPCPRNVPPHNLGEFSHLTIKILTHKGT